MPAPAEPVRLAVARSRAEEVMDRHIGEGRTLQADSDQVVTEEHHDDWEKRRQRWVKLTGEGLRSIYTSEEPQKEFESSARAPRIIGDAGAAQEFNWEREAVGRSINTLESLRERLEYLESPAESSALPQPPLEPRGDEKVFLVHGHASEAKETVGRLLEKTGDHEVVILHEQPSEGRTLIEKFEDHAKASDHAIVLLTADDVGGEALVGGAEPDLQPRARQNVVFELGFFAGSLGRSHVAVLYEAGVELPSDFKGVVYIPLDEGGTWRFQLLTELRGAGLTYDLNRIPT
jgi:predicted nucleotide-binding protein